VNETTMTIIGNLTADPELRFTAKGVAVASFTIASTPRVFNKQANEWHDGDALFLRCSLWKEAAENAAESLTRGSRVIATGRLKQRSFETREGEKRTVIELDVEEIGPSLRSAVAKVSKVGRQAEKQQKQPPQQKWVVDDDPWGANGSDDAPPF
jgi:single-strand DNA-binding protein